jgi:molybdenum cofactor synthesis domain-containing protein
MKMHAFGRLLPVETARARALAAVVPIRSREELLLDEALGRVACRTVRARRPIPAFARASWDGYALRSVDTKGASPRAPVTLRIVGEVFAEDRLRRPLRAGETAAIATGGQLPRSADAVEIFEDVLERPGAIRVRRPVPVAARVSPPGDDYASGDPVVSAGEVLTPAALGGLSAIGAERVVVYRRPRIAILPNGNELVAPGGRLGRGQIFESNSRTLAAVVRAAGGEPDPLPPVSDDPVAIDAALRAALATHDAVLATGGSSVGEHDYLPTLFPKIGRLLFHGIAVRPGKPTLAAVARGKLLLGMPGHPTSCLANGYWLLLPILRRLARLPGPGWIDGTAVLDRPAGRLTEGLSTVVPLHLEGERATPTFHASSAITSLSGANAFALLPPGRGPLPRGHRLAVHLLPPPLGVFPSGAP